MKKVILFAAILFAGVSVVKAEGAVATSATTTANNTSILKVKLGTFQHILVTGAATIEYTKQEDYLPAGVVKQNEASNVVVSVSSAGGFTVNAVALDLQRSGGLSGTLGAEYIQVSAIKIDESPANTATKVSNLKVGGAVITSVTGGMNISYNLLFEANGADVYRAAFDAGKSVGEVQDYETTVTYTIAAI